MGETSSPNKYECHSDATFKSFGCSYLSETTVRTRMTFCSRVYRIQRIEVTQLQPCVFAKWSLIIAAVCMSLRIFWYLSRCLHLCSVVSSGALVYLLFLSGISRSTDVRLLGIVRWMVTSLVLTSHWYRSYVIYLFFFFSLRLSRPAVFIIYSHTFLLRYFCGIWKFSFQAMSWRSKSRTP